MLTRAYVLYAVNSAFQNASNKAEATAFLQSIAENPYKPESVLWAASWLRQKLQEHCVPESDNLNVPVAQPLNDVLELPYWILNERVHDRIPISVLVASKGLAANLRCTADFLDTQSQVELVLAFGGLKVSRLSLDLDTAYELQRALQAPLVCSRHVIVAESDEKLPGFSNVMTKVSCRSSHMRAENMISVYVAQDWRDAVICCVLDDFDLAGDLLGIPHCCRRWFSQNWDACVRQWRGDMAFASMCNLLDQSLSYIPWQCNVYALYFGGSFLSHFPCSVACRHTISLVDEKSSWIGSFDPALHQRIDTIQRSKFWLARDRSFSRTDPDDFTKWTAIHPI